MPDEAPSKKPFRHPFDVHRMMPGSHERLWGPECMCSARWDRWNDRCSDEEVDNA